MSPQCLRELLSPLDVLLLRALVSAGQQDHNLCSAMHMVDPLSRPMVDTHFQDAPTDASGIAGISRLHVANAADNARDRIGVPEAAQPARKLRRLAHLDHEGTM